MIQSIPAPTSLDSGYRCFLQDLAAAGFKGEISHHYADRTVLATDNSIYQRLPQAAVFPRDTADVELLAKLLGRSEHRGVVVTPRGGGTGTNGQSLTDGIVVDLSRHLNKILWIDPERRVARVQAGVVKDQLNAALKEHGLFFAPELSTSNRATIGGMINTDASGQGSCTYGKTRDHVLELEVVLLGGDRFASRSLNGDELNAQLRQTGPVGNVWRCAHRIASEKSALIEAGFPKLNRCLTGYDLAHLNEPGNHFNLNSVLCGSEGSLGFIVEAEIGLLPIPAHSILVNVRYASFMDALRDAQALMQHKPLSIETVDSRVLMLAMEDIVWQDVAEYFPGDSDKAATRGVNLIEFCGNTEDELQRRVSAFTLHLANDSTAARLGHTIAVGHAAVNKVYAMRKRAVGLLGNVQGEVRPQPFVEDTAVPPERLADYIAEFRALLDGHNLSYGMFGHVDAGVLHVRPALNLKDPTHASLIRTISDEVARLTIKYGGVLWGEHGKGVRSEYAPTYFGPLYAALQEIKAAFDPHNQLNPGKIATPAGREARLLHIDEVSLRADSDRQIDERVWQSYESAVHCNGNGACYNFDPNDAMCPSWKATRERKHSPKGRASLLREWLRLQGNAGVDVLQVAERQKSFLAGLPARWRNSRQRRTHPGEAPADFSLEVYDAMAACLACKSCAGQCPVKVNVPDFRSRFLELYHTRYLRPIKDYFIGSLEFSIPYLARAPWLYNKAMSSALTRRLLDRYAGLVDSPLLSRVNLKSQLRHWGVREATSASLTALTDSERSKSVILVQDAFTRYFDAQVFAAFIELAARLGYTVWLAPFMPNGKPLHVLGFLRAFHKTARKSAAMLGELGSYGVPLVGLDPAMTLVYRQEYAKLPSLTHPPTVLLPQEWLVRVLPEARPGSPTGHFQLLNHCTEKTTAPTAAALWPEVFARVGLTLKAQASGCCGMSGTYGHESRNVTTSRQIYSQSWEPILKAGQTEFLATGYSCRSQVKRMGQQELRHPVQALLEYFSRDQATTAIEVDPT